MMTVGPVTTMIAPKSRDMGQDSPRHSAPDLSQGPGNRDPGEDQAPNAAGGGPELGDLEVEAALEKDDGHEESDEGLKDIAEITGRMHEAQDRAREDPPEHEKKDGRNAQFPGDPLGPGSK